MHPEITRELVRSRVADSSRHSARRSAQFHVDIADQSARASGRRRPVSSGLRFALRQASRLSPGH